jgi:nicotinate-nucleotide adenylyltransferase
MKLGIYGGSFNPVHLGHLLVARAAIEELGLERLFFVPAAQSPFKPENKPAPDHLRLRWLRLALAGCPDWEVDAQELHLGGTSYTIETLRHFNQKFPGAELFYLIGADNAAKLNEWREAAELATLAEFVVMPRPGGNSTASPSSCAPPFRGRVLKGFPFGVSSSEIRARVKAGLPIDNLVPAAVAEAIRSAQAYR